MSAPAPGFAVHPSVLEPDIELEERVSRTNLSEVWRGRRRADRREVAVKFALTTAAAVSLESEAAIVRELSGADETRRLTRRLEGRVSARLEYELGSWRVHGIVPAEYVPGPVPHIVMPWMGRRTFRDMLAECRNGDSRASAVATLYKVIRTVALVHLRGFMHGDLKPENILVDANGEPWLTDFGMARTIHAARLDSRVSRSMSDVEGAWGGTLHYMPPEGVQGEAPALPWDVYAIGVMLHEALLGGRPDRAASPESLRASLPAEVLEVLLRALAWAPADRFPDVRHLMHALEPLRDELTLVGRARVANQFGRAALGALAAFFVVFRYASVLALLLAYVQIGLWIVRGYWAALILVPLAAYLHWKIRWEGPESYAEEQDRRMGRWVSGPR